MHSRELETEQRYLTALHDRVDVLRDHAAARLATARADGDADAVVFWQAELRRLESAEDGLYFGRLDLRDGGRVHIGRLGLFRDGDDEPLLVDWRAPAARAFYTATAAAAHGVLRRRRITTRGRTVVALNDELLDVAAAGEDTLTGEAELLAALTADRTGRMHDVVATLQAEQDRIVRDEYPGVLVVQGGPGTGKTAVALHRLAYLLYTRPRLRDRGVLVVGPSQIFLDYIGQVLPGLGEHTVVTATVAELFPGSRVTRRDTQETAVAKGRADMADRVAAAVRSRVRLPDEPVEVEFEQQLLLLDQRSCRRAVAAARRTGLPHNRARLVFQQEAVGLLARSLEDRMESVVLTETGEAIDGGSPDGRLGEADLRALAAAGVVIGPNDVDGAGEMLDETDRASLRKALLADAGVQHALDLLWPPLTAEGVVADLLATPVGGWSAEDIPLLDEAAALVGDREGVPTYGHVVVDEAQELSAMAWRMLMRRCPTRSMTVVGDLVQTGSPAGASSWDGVLRPHVADRWRLAQLTVNYRTPAEIMAATAGLFAAHHPGLRPPRSVRTTGEPPWRLRTTPEDLPEVIARVVARVVAAAVAANADRRLAVIAPPAHHGRLAALLSVPTPPDLTEPVVLLTPGQSKGLEFDSVVVADPAAILDAGPLGHNDLYVAMTRATRRLGVVHPGPPPPELTGIREIDLSSSNIYHQM